MNSADDSQDSFLQTYAIQFPGLVHRIVIKAAAKPEIRDMLDQNNISERTLFPGLPGLCDWLRRYYGITGTGLSAVRAEAEDRAATLQAATERLRPRARGALA